MQWLQARIQNDIVYGIRKKDIPDSRFLTKVMVSAGVCWKGKTRIHFQTSNFNSPRLSTFLPLGKTTCTLQYGATSRTSKVTQEHLDEEVPEFIKKDEWVPQSPNCNPWMWDSLSEKVCCGRTAKFTKEELQQRITECWEEIYLAELRICIDVLVPEEDP
jgi:hypothetical protein